MVKVQKIRNKILFVKGGLTFEYRLSDKEPSPFDSEPKITGTLYIKNKGKLQPICTDLAPERQELEKAANEYLNEQKVTAMGNKRKNEILNNLKKELEK